MQQEQEGAKLLPAESSVPLFIFQARRIMMPSPPLVKKKVARPEDGKTSKKLTYFFSQFSKKKRFFKSKIKGFLFGCMDRKNFASVINDYFY